MNSKTTATKAPVGRPVKCRVGFVLSDGVKAYNMEKIFPLPCWLTEGMQLDLNLWAWPEVSYVTTNPMTCEQHALLRDDLKCQGADELGETLKLWIDDGWSIESEDHYR